MSRKELLKFAEVSWDKIDSKMPKVEGAPLDEKTRKKMGSASFSDLSFYGIQKAYGKSSQLSLFDEVDEDEDEDDEDDENIGKKKAQKARKSLTLFGA